jgi:hypothetical protein
MPTHSSRFVRRAAKARATTAKRRPAFRVSGRKKLVEKFANREKAERAAKFGRRVENIKAPPMFITNTGGALFIAVRKEIELQATNP